VRSGAAAEHDGYFHEAAFYDSDDDFVALVEPFLRDGVAAGEPTLVACAERNTALLREAVGDLDGIAFVPGEQQYRSPGFTVAAYRAMFGSLVAGGASQIRVIGDVPHPGVGVPWDGWARYEAAINHAYDDFPLWGLCPYDTRTTPDHVLEEVQRTHQWLASESGHHRNHGYLDPRLVLQQLSPSPDPIEVCTPDLEAVDPTPASARHLVEALAQGTDLEPSSVANLVLAVSEVVTNSIRHGEPPRIMRAWSERDRVVVTVKDGGPGLADPLTGLLEPDPEQPSGRGMWIVHQVCSDVGLRTEADGFTVRLCAGRPF